MITDEERARREQLAEETILTDERLRRDLTDDQFDAILGWALPAADAAAGATFAIEDPAAAADDLYRRLDELKDRIRSAAEDATRLAAEQNAALQPTAEPEAVSEPEPAPVSEPAAPEPEPVLPAPPGAEAAPPPVEADAPGGPEDSVLHSLLRKLKELTGGAL